MALDASSCWAGLVPYTADAQGSALLLCVSADGSEWGAFLGPHDGGEEARLRAAVAALCAGTQGLLAPAGSRADEAAAHLLSKLQAGKGVHRLATSGDEGVLFLTPTRRVAPPAASRLEWVPAAELLAALDGADAARVWSAELRRLLCAPSGRQALRQIAQIRAGPARRAKLSSDPDETPMDASVPRRVATNLFLAELPACRNTALLGMLGIGRVLLLLPDEGEVSSGGEAGEGGEGGEGSEGGGGAAAQLEAEAAETAEAIGAELAAVLTLTPTLTLTLTLTRARARTRFRCAARRRRCGLARRARSSSRRVAGWRPRCRTAGCSWQAGSAVASHRRGWSPPSSAARPGDPACRAPSVSAASCCPSAG